MPFSDKSVIRLLGRTSSLTHLCSTLPDELEECWAESVEQAQNGLFVGLTQCGWESVEPGENKWTPSQQRRLHVDHTTAGHLGLI